MAKPELCIANNTTTFSLSGQRVNPRRPGRQMRMARALECNGCSSTTAAPVAAIGTSSKRRQTSGHGRERASRKALYGIPTREGEHPFTLPSVAGAQFNFAAPAVVCGLITWETTDPEKPQIHRGVRKWDAGKPSQAEDEACAVDGEARRLLLKWGPLFSNVPHSTV
jgi:hypothetical protein